MKPIIFHLAILLLFVSNQGCSIYKAANQPGPVPVDTVGIGSSRAELISVFGSPKHTDSINRETTDIFEFVDGYHGASKLRIIFYAAADFFTLGLAELVLWPLEMAALDGKEGRAIASYDTSNKVNSLKVTDKDGTPWDPPEVLTAENQDTTESEYEEY